MMMAMTMMMMMTATVSVCVCVCWVGAVGGFLCFSLELFYAPVCSFLFLFCFRDSGFEMVKYIFSRTYEMADLSTSFPPLEVCWFAFMDRMTLVSLSLFLSTRTCYY